MAITITKRPYLYCFSGNNIVYQLYSSLAATDSTIYFEVRVRFKAPDDTDYAMLPILPYAPDEGYASLDIKDIIDSLLTADVPDFLNESKPYEASGQTGYFYIEYREITTTNPDPLWETAEAGYSSFVFKGGLNHYKYRGNNFWVNYFFVQKPFLTWQRSGRMAVVTERMYLAWLNLTDVAADEINVLVKVTYTDGSSTTELMPFAATKGKIYYVPTGATQLSLLTLDTTKRIYTWEISITDNARTPLSGTFKYEADNRNDYNDITLHYRNSFYCLDSVRVRGVITRSTKYIADYVTKMLMPGYYESHFIQPESVTANNKEIFSWKGDVGHVPKEDQDRLRDLHLVRELWWEIEKKWWPLKNITGDITLNTSDDNRWHMPIEFTMADEGASYYTPDTVDLGDGIFTENVCRAFFNDVVITLADDGFGQKTCTVNFAELDPQNASSSFRYQLNGPNYPIEWIEVPYNQLPLVFTLAPDQHFDLILQAICTNNIYGAQFTTGIDTTTNVQAPPPTPSGNCFVNNGRAEASVIRVTINGVDVFYAKVAANSAASFNQANATGADIKVEYVAADATSIVVYVTAPPYQPNSFDGHFAEFNSVDIISGMSIIIH